MATKPTNSKAQTKSPRSTAKAARPQPVAADDSGAVNPKPDAAAPAPEGSVLRLKELIDRVTEVSGVKKKDVRSVVDAVLEHLGETLKRGDSLNLPALGHMRVVRKATEETPVATLKLRQVDPAKAKAGKKSNSGAAADTEALAEDSEEV